MATPDFAERRIKAKNANGAQPWRIVIRLGRALSCWGRILLPRLDLFRLSAGRAVGLKPL